MKKLIALLAVIFVGITLTACSPAQNGTDAGNTTASTTKEAPSVLGNWKAEGLEAVIADNSIEINIVSPDAKSLYWKGTFPAGFDKTVKSVADTEALASSMLGSTDAEKIFTIDGDEITFELSMMGTTKKIHLKRA